MSVAGTAKDIVQRLHRLAASCHGPPKGEAVREQIRAFYFSNLNEAHNRKELVMVEESKFELPEGAPRFNLPLIAILAAVLWVPIALVVAAIA